MSNNAEKWETPMSGPRSYKTPMDWIQSDDFNRHTDHPDNQYHKINIQQLAKSPIIMDCLVAPEGYSFVQLDYTSLEPYVLAEFSGCPTYKEVYASGRIHDVYFFVTCKLLDDDGKISAVYNLEDPTPESVKAAKKQFKPERNVGKVFQLMSTYKAGAAAIQRKLTLFGFDYTKKQVEEIRERYWGPELFGAVIDYENDLLTQVDQNNGYFFNGFNRPLVVTDRKRKDVVNSFCQSTGHDCLDFMVLQLERIINEHGISATPIVEDFHDETIWMCPTEQAEMLADAMRQAVDKTNGIIKYGTPLVGEPEITKTFTEFKGPDPIGWYEDESK